jgi:hypothetical protein
VAGRAQPSRRGDVDDRAAAALGHRGQNELRGQHDRAQVQVERALPPRRVRRREVRLLGSSRVVNQHADRTGRGDSRVDASPVTEVRAEERAANPFGRNRALPVVEVGDDQVHALGGEPFRDPGADPVRASRHQCGHSAKFHGGIVGPGTDIPFRSQPGVRMAV